MTEDPLERLIGLLARVPGLGRRSARRAALKMLADPARLMLPLAEAMQQAAAAIRPCSRCGNLDAADPRRICADPGRDCQLLCVVEGWRICGRWNGPAPIAGCIMCWGVLSPLAGVGPEQLAVAGLLARVAAGGIREVILALPATVEGATTAHYLADCLAGSEVSVTRLAQGVPMGGALEVLDEGTITAALKARRPA